MLVVFLVSLVLFAMFLWMVDPMGFHPGGQAKMTENEHAVPVLGRDS
jgi:hypothetical protein